MAIRNSFLGKTAIGMCVLHAAESALTPGDPVTEWCPNVLSFASLLCSCGLLPMASFMASIHPSTLSLPLFLLPSVFPALLSFPKNPALSQCARSGTAAALSFLPPVMLQAYLGDTVGSVPDHCNDASNVKCLAARCTWKLCLHYTAVY